MLVVENIFKYYNQQVILNDVSFSLEKGEVLGLLGPNGAGKTTLMRIINKIIEQDEGHVSFQGKLLKEKDLSVIGYLPEERGLYPSMTVEKQILFIAQLRGLTAKEAKAQMDFWLKRFAIDSWRKKRIEELSKGMAQKIQFICSLIHEPSVLILDEPFSGFDPINVDLIRKELIAYKEKGNSIIISTHNMNNVEELCDRVLLMNRGELILKGSVQELKEQFKEGLFEIQFEGNMIAFANALWVGYEIVDQKNVGENLFTVSLKMRKENKMKDLLQAVMNQVNIISVEEVLPSMETIFVKAVQSQTVVESE